jgi:hypothetical protein
VPRERITDEFSTEHGDGEADEMEHTIDLIIAVVINAVIDMHPEERSGMNPKTMISVRMTVDEGVGYLGSNVSHMSGHTSLTNWTGPHPLPPEQPVVFTY